MNLKSTKLLLVALAVLGLGACSDSPAPATKDGQDVNGDQAQCPVAADLGVPTLNDAQIVQLVMTINTGEIQVAQLAQQQQPQPSQAVLDFANRMVQEHTQANQQLQAVLPVLNITPADSPLNQQLLASTNQTMAILRTSAAGADFDRAYMDTQVAMHANALFLADTVLQPQLQNAQLRQLSVAARALIQGHLNDASDLQRTLPARTYP